MGRPSLKPKRSFADALANYAEHKHHFVVAAHTSVHRTVVGTPDHDIWSRMAALFTETNTVLGEDLRLGTTDGIVRLTDYPIGELYLSDT